MILKKVHLPLTFEERGELLKYYYECYFNTDQDIPVFESEYQEVIQALAADFVPVELEKLIDFMDGVIEIVPHIEDAVVSNEETQSLVSINALPSLSDDEFFVAYRRGELNSLDLPAREYLSRQEAIKDEVMFRVETKGMNPDSSFARLMKTVPNIEDTKNFRAHLVLYAQEGEHPNFIVLNSRESAMHALEDFKRFGAINVQDPFSGDIEEKRVHTVAYAVTEVMLKRKGEKEVQFFPRSHGTNVPE